MKKVRIDKLLVEYGLFESRNKAQSAIDEGIVSYRGQVINKSNIEVDDTEGFKESIQIALGNSNRYVSRGGLKIEGALARTKLSVQDFSILDVGISTGGFTDCLLQSGAGKVVGIDVGHKQIHPSLLKFKNVYVFEGVHARDLTKQFFTDAGLADSFDLIVGDVSFISLRNILPAVVPFLKPGAKLLFLVKPQFELEKKDLGKGGIVKDSSSYQRVEKMITSLIVDLNLSPLDYFESSITGTDGNREFFIYAKKI